MRFLKGKGGNQSLKNILNLLNLELEIPVITLKTWDPQYS